MEGKNSIQKVKSVKNNEAGGIGITFIIPAVILVILVICYFLIPSFNRTANEIFNVLTSDDPAIIEHWVKKFGAAGPVVLILAFVVQMFLFVVPNVLLMLIAIVSYGPVWGSLISLTGVFFSSSLGFMIGRYLGPITVLRFISEKTFRDLSNFINEYGVAAIVITRVSSLSNDSLSIVAGILKMAYWKYILATLSGISPLIVLLAIFGEYGKIERALIWIAAASIIGLIIYIVIDKRKERRKELSKK